jgi:hypothetical protein
MRGRPALRAGTSFVQNKANLRRDQGSGIGGQRPDTWHPTPDPCAFVRNEPNLRRGRVSGVRVQRTGTSPPSPWPGAFVRNEPNPGGASGGTSTLWEKSYDKSAPQRGSAKQSQFAEGSRSRGQSSANRDPTPDPGAFVRNEPNWLPAAQGPVEPIVQNEANFAGVPRNGRGTPTSGRRGTNPIWRLAHRGDQTNCAKRTQFPVGAQGWTRRFGASVRNKAISRANQPGPEGPPVARPLRGAYYMEAPLRKVCVRPPEGPKEASSPEGARNEVM